MQDGEVGLCGLQLLGSQDVAVLQAQVVFLVEEALALDTGHVQDVQVGHHGFQIGGLGVGDALLLQSLLLDVAGQLQLSGRDKDEVDVLVAAESVDQGVDGTTELQIAAEAHGEVIQTALLTVDGEEVGQGLGGVVVAAVTGIDDRDVAELSCGIGGAFLGVAHGDNVGVAAHGVQGVAHGLALGSRAGVGLREAQDAAAQTQHGGLEGETGTSRGLEEQGSQLLVCAGVLVLGGVLDDIFGHGDEFIDLLNGEVNDVQQISCHLSFPP